MLLRCIKRGGNESRDFGSDARRRQAAVSFTRWLNPRELQLSNARRRNTHENRWAWRVYTFGLCIREYIEEKLKNKRVSVVHEVFGSNFYKLYRHRVPIKGNQDENLKMAPKSFVHY